MEDSNAFSLGDPSVKGLCSAKYCQGCHIFIFDSIVPRVEALQHHFDLQWAEPGDGNLLRCSILYNVSILRKAGYREFHTANLSLQVAAKYEELEQTTTR